MVLLLQILPVLLYILAARCAVRRLTGRRREIIFALINVTGYYFCFVFGQDIRLAHIFPLYCLLVLGQFATLQWFADKEGWKPWIAFFMPILALVAIRYAPLHLFASWNYSLKLTLQQKPSFSYAPFFIGLSYLAFRTSHLVLEIRNGLVKKPGLWEYLSFCFFVPTMPVGPINAYSHFRSGLEATPPVIPESRALMRILVGYVKYKFFGTVLCELDYSNLLLDGHYHPWIDLPVAMVFYYLYLYCNFSGFCDMAIGAAGLIGIPVPENFNNPFAARNMREFWNRWHITLSQYMRDVVFAPLSKLFVRLLGSDHLNHAIALTVFVVFLLIGIWHGVGWNYAAFGVAQALGVVTTHYYTIGLKKWLRRDGFKAYNANPWIHALAVTLTFTYYAATLFLFANTFAQMKEIFAALK